MSNTTRSTNRHYLSPDGDGEPTIWYDDGLYGDDPLAIASINTTRSAQWHLMLLGAGLDDDHTTLPREDLAELAEELDTLATDIANGDATSYTVDLLAKRVVKLAEVGQ